MARSMHYQTSSYHGYARLACGASRGIQVHTLDKAEVTCKKCMKVLGLDVPKEAPVSVPAQVQAELERMFTEIEPEFQARLQEQYRAEAENQLVAWLNVLKTNVDGYVQDGHHGKIPVRQGHYVRYPSNGYSCEPHFWNLKQEAHAMYYVDYDLAKRDADFALAQAKAQFLYRQGHKIATALNSRIDLGMASGHLHTLRGAVEGTIEVVCQNQDSFKLYTQIIMNCRSEPRFITFFQYPSRFVDIRKGLVSLGSKSEVWMKGNF